MFVVYGYLNPVVTQNEESVIEVDEARLLEFVQYRSKQFDEQQARARLEAMSLTARLELIDEYVLEEALFRAAKRFGLETDDYVIRRRLVQKMDFMAEGVAGLDGHVDEAELQTYYAENLARYYKPPTITFTHVYFSSAQRGSTQAEALAANMLEQLNQASVEFAQAPQFGERFAYQLNYVERPFDEVADHFGDAMAQRLAGLPAAADRWYGPFASPLGSHLVLITTQQAGYQPELVQVLANVRQDYLAARQQQRRRAFAQEIVGGYELRIDPLLSGSTTP